MRRLRRGAPFGWLLTLLFPLLVAGGQGGAPTLGDSTALPRHAAVAAITAERLSPSRQASGERRHDLAEALTAALVAAGSGAAGGHPVAPLPPGSRAHLPAARFGPRPADDDSRPLTALPAAPARAPPSTGV